MDIRRELIHDAPAPEEPFLSTPIFQELGNTLMSVLPIRRWADPFRFDPNAGVVVAEPPGEGAGYWAGAPGVTTGADGRTVYLTYRIRRPHGVEPDRGAEVHLARSADGVTFEDIWVGRKESLGTTSIERCALAQRDDGSWCLWISYVDPADGRWRIDRVTAADPSRFDFTKAEPSLTADACRNEGVKDPFVFRVAGQWQMLVSFATGEGQAAAAEMHGTHDAYNTGLIKSRTGLAVSEDGLHWNWEGEIFGPSEDGWDRYCSRLGTLWRENGIWLGMYDGSASVAENYEERVGLAYSFDLRRWHRVTQSGPLMHQPHASGALRYFDVLELPDRRLAYYESAHPDGSHDLRVMDVS